MNELDHQRSPPRRGRLLLAAVALAAATALHFLVLLELLFHAPEAAPKVSCISYDPRHRMSRLSPGELKRKSDIPREWIEEDLEILSQVAGCVRTYYSSRGMEHAAEIAAAKGMEIILGADITADPERNAKECAAVVEIANRSKNVRSVIVGNEVLLASFTGTAEKVSHKELRARLAWVRERTELPVSTAEPLNTWYGVNWLHEATDFTAINELPYWSGIEASRALPWLMNELASYKRKFPQRAVLLAEFGWPGAGPPRGEAIPSIEAQFELMNQIGEAAATLGIDYNYFEGFDQIWKSEHAEGRIGTQWGLFTADGLAKSGSAYARRQLHWFLASAALAALLCLLLGWRKRDHNLPGLLFVFLVVHLGVGVFTSVLKVLYDEYFFSHASAWFLIVLPQGLLLATMFILLGEAAEVIGRKPLRRLLRPAPAMQQPVEATGSPADDAPPVPSSAPLWPFVSIHVACCNEPPAMVIETLEALLALDYPAFEVLVIDNNTRDETLYRPVEAFCLAHPARLRFFHEDFVEGFKAGALNLTRQRTAERAEIIAIVDSDYVVEPSWLRDLVGSFTDKSVAAVQAPQAYRYDEGSFFEQTVRDEYDGFFKIGMVQRNERNAIIQHGTMLLLRKEVLDEVGGWATWCITEDTELEIRILRHGYRVLYTDRVYGRGLVPDSADGYTKQRFRWVFGAMTIFKRYHKSLLWGDGTLTRAQRYHFLTGWVPWLADAFAPLFSTLGLLGGAYVVYRPLYLPPVEFALPFLFLILGRFLFVMTTYRLRVGIGWWRSLLSNIGGTSLTYAISAAVLRSLFTNRYGFQVTPKAGSQQKVRKRWLWNVLRYRMDAPVGVALLVLGVWVPARFGFAHSTPFVWGAVLWVLALPSVCGVALSLASWRHRRAQRA